ncbi:MAG: hypothetical protein ACLFTA_01535 [Candidatus Nanohaloarchaea archaeon]
MADDWENLVIETGVDSLLNYLAENKKASCSTISSEIGVDESRVRNWADALADENLIEKHHTLTSGLVLEFTEQNIEESEKKKEEIEEDLDVQTEELRKKLDEKSNLVREKREELLQRKDKLSEEEREEIVNDTVTRLEELENRIDEQLRVKGLDHQTLKLVNEIERVLHEVEQLIRKQLDEEQDRKLNQKTGEVIHEVEKVLEKAEKEGELSEEEQDIRMKIKAVEKLEDNIRKARRNRDEESKGLKSRLKSLIPVSKKHSGSEKDVVERRIAEDEKIKKSEVPEETYQELVDTNRVTEVMRKISLLKNPDYEALLRAESSNRDRPDLVDYLEERIEDGR